MLHQRVALLAMLTATVTAGCGSDEVPYTPRESPSGVTANLPPVPNVPQKPIKSGDAYTVWGVSYHMRSRVHQQDVLGKPLKVAGYVVKTNLSEAPPCAVHPTGKADPDDCDAPIPAFWIADTPDAELKDSIKVMGWASNYAQLHDAITAIKKQKNKEKRDPVMDAFWGVEIPDPLPVKGQKVTVKGTYGTTFTRATSGAEADPIMGILTYDEIEVQENVDELATLPGMR
jgi:hypothetical protein